VESVLFLTSNIKNIDWTIVRYLILLICLVVVVVLILSLETVQPFIM
jgi:hypothetical protein